MAQDGFDKSMDLEQEMAKAPKVNKFDGLIHAQNGKIYDPVSKKEVVQEHLLLQTGDNYDETFEHDQKREQFLLAQKKTVEPLKEYTSTNWFDRQFE